MAGKTLSKIKQLHARTKAFLEEKSLEFVDTAQAPVWGRFAHFMLLVVKSFVRNRCPARASALAYTTLLALIPMLAIAISVSTSLLKSEGEKPIQNLIDQLVKNVAPALNLEVKTGDADGLNRQQEVVNRITTFIANIRTGTLGVTSTLALMLVAIGLLRTIEAAFNEIWGVTRGRGWVASVIQYWATITLGPIILVLAMALTSGPHFKTTASIIQRMPFIGSLVLQLLPFGVLTLAFAAFYQLMPNTRVRWTAALVGGAVGGCLWQLNNLFNVLYVSKVVTYSKIYGSLSILPLFLIGMYFSWLIVLLGAQVAYAYQNRQAYLQDKLAESASQRDRELVALQLMTHVARHFQNGQPPPGAQQLATVVGAPSRLVTQIVQCFVQAKLVVAVADQESGWVPARPLDRISAHDILQALRVGPGQELATRSDPVRTQVRAEFDRINRAERDVANRVTLDKLVRETAAAQTGSEPPAR